MRFVPPFFCAPARRFGLRLICCAALAVLAGCHDQPQPPPKHARVGVEIATARPYAATIALTGVVAARITSNLSFRVSGRILTRLADVGDHVRAGQMLAALNPAEQKANLASAQAGVSSAEAKLRQAAQDFGRQQRLLPSGTTTRTQYDLAEESLRAARSGLIAAKAQLGLAQDQLNQTILRANADGVITARNAEKGEVIQEAATIYTLAQDGARDAVFDVYETVLARGPQGRAIDIALVSDPAVVARARLRELSPIVDPSTGTIRVKMEIIDPPPAMTLGAAVAGLGRYAGQKVVDLPWTALSSSAGEPAVWLIDPARHAVFLQPVTVTNYDLGRMIVGSGVAPGAHVVTKGQQLLYPGQVVDEDMAGAP